MIKVWNWLKKEAVLSIATILAVVSMFFVTPSAEYIGYIDFRVLAILYALMLVVAGIRQCGVFERMIEGLTRRFHSVVALELILVYICFFSSMFITNDVALLTFVPFAIVLCKLIHREEDMIFVVVMQTIAANLGSMVTPIGNPQNLYVYTSFELGLGEFVVLLLPYAIAALVLLTVCTIVYVRIRLRRTSGNIEASPSLETVKEEATITSVKRPSLWRLILLCLLFVVALLSVLRIVDYRIMLGIVVVGILIVDFHLLAKADYILLATFVAFFVLVGNLKNIPAFSSFLGSMMAGREFFVTLLTSQIISNVPATMLLSGFTNDAKSLLLGADIGGLGTIIASMASLISLRQYSAVPGARKGRFFAVFTLWNVIFLIIMVGLYLVLRALAG